MSDKEADRDDVFDVDRIRQVVELMIEHDLTEVDLRQHGQTIRLRRGGEPAAYAQAIPAVPAAASVPAATAAAENPEDDASMTIIRSPMVGTFYNRANPEAEPFVRLGQEVSTDTTVCIIEAMKVFNEIPAEVSGQIVAVLVENEAPVDFGKPLFKVRKHA
jgi:acetyl-CoA carboxylase biotin carboxyl carrier protein